MEEACVTMQRFGKTLTADDAGRMLLETAGAIFDYAQLWGCDLHEYVTPEILRDIIGEERQMAIHNNNPPTA